MSLKESARKAGRQRVRLGMPGSPIYPAADMLKSHMPYLEADHVMAQDHSVPSGASCIEDLEECRCDRNFTKALGAEAV